MEEKVWLACNFAQCLICLRSSHSFNYLHGRVYLPTDIHICILHAKSVYFKKRRSVCAAVCMCKVCIVQPVHRIIRQKFPSAAVWPTEAGDCLRIGGNYRQTISAACIIPNEVLEQNLGIRQNQNMDHQGKEPINNFFFALRLFRSINLCIS